MTLRLEEDGAERVRSALTGADIAAVAGLFRPTRRPGARLVPADLHPIAALLGEDGAIGKVAARFGPAAMRPVRAILIDKMPGTNWSLPWHQDRVLAVRERRDVPGFTGWTLKDGILHVQAPEQLMAEMLTIRVHVDAVSPDNAPLCILRGSHKLGRLNEEQIDRQAALLEPATCLADPGDLWVYRTPVIHSSDVQRHGVSRRVLQLDYAGFDLPGDLAWAYEELH